MRILAVIPARSGSKSIKDKNIVDINGKPLLAYSIETALELKKLGLIDRVIVSTDSAHYANIAKKYGAEVPFLRPKKISDDKAKSIEFIIHAINFLEKQDQNYDAILILQPTSPLRKIDIMRKALENFIKSTYDSAISCYKEEYICDLVSYHKDPNNENRLIPLNPNHNKGGRRQGHQSIYVRNGCIYLTKTTYIKNNHLIISDNPMLIEMGKSDSINLDTLEDVELLRRTLCK